MKADVGGLWPLGPWAMLQSTISVPTRQCKGMWVENGKWKCGGRGGRWAGEEGPGAAAQPPHSAPPGCVPTAFASSVPAPPISQASLCNTTDPMLLSTAEPSLFTASCADHCLVPRRCNTDLPSRRRAGGLRCPRSGGAFSAARAQCAVRSATIWAWGRTRDPYFEIPGASLLPPA